MMTSSSVRTRVPFRPVPIVIGLLLVLGTAGASAVQAARSPGHVDCETFLEIAGEDALQVHVSIGAPLLNLITRADPELHRLAGGLESIEAVILELDRPQVAARAVQALRDTETRLLKSGWERLVLIKDEDSEARVLVLNDSQSIQGLVVMVRDDEQVVFANVAGTLDLAAIEELGDAMEIPGLKDVDLEQEP